MTQVYVSHIFWPEERYRKNELSNFTNVYVKNFPETYTDEYLKKLFGPCGTITSATIMKDVNGKSRCFGFVNFQSPNSAAAAVEMLNGTTVMDNKVLFVGRAQRKAEREAELKAKISAYEKLQGTNLYVKFLDDDVDDEKLREVFSEFGTITSCKVMLDAHGHSKGCGFVAFSTLEEASKALKEMSHKFIGQKPLYVAIAQRKEERKAYLPGHFAEMRAKNLAWKEAWCRSRESNQLIKIDNMSWLQRINVIQEPAKLPKFIHDQEKQNMMLNIIAPHILLDKVEKMRVNVLKIIDHSLPILAYLRKAYVSPISCDAFHVGCIPGTLFPF
ncbi:polyadenylate-binding protein 5-like [Gastrolobium bilobum]|uniref:polyadenylate-binding protein 5-like n=1 Tax=Gastrolobium bilobum TaxID=150636 RepID=UPI002AB319D8|nr:polyadenylate-binding protein 5-like [Gastrolobium bilobum]